MLIVIADQLGQSVGDMYKAAFIPAFILVGVYVLAMVVLAVVRPSWVPALPPEARIYRQPNGGGGYPSLSLLTAASVVVGAWLFTNYEQAKRWTGWEGTVSPPTDERVVVALMVGIFFAWLVAVIDRVLKLGLLSEIAKRVTFVLIPPLLLVFLVLGTIFLGVATPTEGGAMGAAGAILMALSRRRLTMTLMRQALDSSAKLSIFVLFVLIGSTIFALTFQAIDGPTWVKALFKELPGGELGFLIFVNVLIFILGCFIDFFEIAFILLPLLLPVVEALEINLVFFGVMVALNLQTSFLTPPFGFALFYLRSVAPKKDYVDVVTRRNISALKTTDIYRGAVAFVVLQVLLVVLVVWNPQIILSGLGEQKKLDVQNVNISITPEEEEGEEEPPPMLMAPPPAPAPAN